MPVSANLLTYFSSPPDRCAWPLSPFSITAGSDPFRRYLSLSLPLYQSLCHLSLHTSGSRDQHPPSAYGERGRERIKKNKKNRRDIDFLMLFCWTFQIKRTEVKSDWKPPGTTAAPTHTHTAGNNNSNTTECAVNLPFLSSNTSTMTLDKINSDLVVIEDSLILPVWTER